MDFFFLGCNILLCIPTWDARAQTEIRNLFFLCENMHWSDEMISCPMWIYIISFLQGKWDVEWSTSCSRWTLKKWGKHVNNLRLQLDMERAGWDYSKITVWNVRFLKHWGRSHHKLSKSSKYEKKKTHMQVQLLILKNTWIYTTSLKYNLEVSEDCRNPKQYILS